MLFEEHIDSKVVAVTEPHCPSMGCEEPVNSKIVATTEPHCPDTGCDEPGD